MNRHKHLARLERLKDAIWKRYGRRGVLDESCFPDGGVWAIWLGLLRDIKECGLSYGYKIDGVRLYYYNELITDNTSKKKHYFTREIKRRHTNDKWF